MIDLKEILDVENQGARYVRFVQIKAKSIDYKDINKLRRFLTERGKIQPRRTSGVCAKHQRMLATAIKRARIMALLPFSQD